MESAIDKLRSKGIRPSIARIRILEYLSGSAEHPTVDMIYQHLLPEIPTLSKTTVYKTAALMVESGLARILHIDEAEARYDADVSEHGHFHCSCCGRVYDFVFNRSLLETEGLEGFVVDDFNFYLKGVCPRCSSK